MEMGHLSMVTPQIENIRDDSYITFWTMQYSFYTFILQLAIGNFGSAIEKKHILYAIENGAAQIKAKRNSYKKGL
jgi:hypothetical protein